MSSVTDHQINLLEKLCNAISVSGDESEVRNIVINEIKQFADDIQIDAMGNVLAVKVGKSKKRLRVMIDAHMDEVGLFVVREDGEGFYQFELIGGVNSRELIGKRVLIGRDHVPAVIGGKPYHLMNEDEAVRIVPYPALRIDAGKPGIVKIGDRATFATDFKLVGPSIQAKAIDNRIGVSTLIELFKNSYENIDFCASFTVQEEIGLRGAKVAAQHFQPDLAISIDSTPAIDLPLSDGKVNTSYNTLLGHGPAVYVADGKAIYDKGLIEYICRIADQIDIPYQIRQPGGGSNNAAMIQSSLSGIRAVAVSIPHRYPHSPVSICRIDDWTNTIKLLDSILQNITPALISQV